MCGGGGVMKLCQLKLIQGEMKTSRRKRKGCHPVTVGSLAPPTGENDEEQPAVKYWIGLIRLLQVLLLYEQSVTVDANFHRDIF